ncbi:AI-2E family transporter [Alsobacter sp. SYSU M60028]|uniref:AI-2E family transporter n=1 Tax=Alsobacter ponti TaxID=2962936 RepID=A0ABT1L8Q5_9HYPH|nr:AI-2E family transporter [Alsobacter ponti]MCP8937876.1 AI-2E family transporter [Alsobacter ponti]
MPETSTPNTVPPAQRPHELDRADGTTSTVIVAIAVVASLYAGRDIFVPIALAILLTFVLAPAVRRLQALRIARPAAVLIVVVLAIGVIGAIGGIVAMQVTELAGNLPRYQTTIREKVQTVRGATAGHGAIERAADLLQDLGQELRGKSDKATTAPAAQYPSAEPPPPPRPEPPKPIPVETHPPEPGPVRALLDLIEPVVHPLATAGLIVIFVVFILLQREDLRNRMIRLAGSNDIQRTTAAIDDAAHRLSRLFLVQLGLNTSFAIVITIGLWLIGLPSPALWGILAGVMRFVPYIGAFLSAVFPLTLALAVDPGWSMLLWTAALYVIVEPLVGHVLEPLLFGKTTGLSPVAVVISAAFWTWLWGPIGLLLATPLTICLVVLGRHVDRLEFLEVMFGSTPALSPQEVFYQRMLASDPLEAADQAEPVLAEKGVAAYYDDVALPGLEMAQADVARGALDFGRVETIRDAAAELVSDLTDAGAAARPAADATSGDAAKTPDATPVSSPRDRFSEAWRGDAPVLCIPGRSPLDEAAARMLAHVLSDSGLPTRVEPAGSLTTARLFHLDPAGVALVCLSYLDTSSPGHMRYAVKRLRRRFPEARVMMGAWGMREEESDRREVVKQTVAADIFVTSIAEAAQLAVEEATSRAPAEREVPADKPRARAAAALAARAVPVK